MSKKLSIATLICFGLGIIGGLVVPTFCQNIEFIGTIYVNLLKMMIIPVLFCSIATSMMKTTGRFATRITAQGIGTFIGMFLCSFSFQYSMVPISAIRQVLLQWVEHSSLQYYRSCQ